MRDLLTDQSLSYLEGGKTASEDALSDQSDRHPVVQGRDGRPFSCHNRTTERSFCSYAKQQGQHKTRIHYTGLPPHSKKTVL